MTLIYIASPYSHPDPAVRQKRYEDVSAYTAKRMMEGAVVYSPIAFNHPLSVRYEMPTDWVFWKHFDCRMIDKCDAMEVLMLDGWDTSVGVSAGQQIFVWVYGFNNALGVYNLGVNLT